MKILTLTDRLWGLGMTTAVYGAVVPALLMLGAGVGKAPAHPGPLKTFDVALPQPVPEPQPEERSSRKPAAPMRERRQPYEAARALRERPASPSDTNASSAIALPEPVEIVVPVKSTPPVRVAEPAPTKPAASMILNGYASRLWSHIASRRPRGMRLAGTTTVTFSLSRTGELGNLSITGKSGNPMLDNLALRTIRGAAPFPAPPEALDEGQLRFTIPFSFR